MGYVNLHCVTMFGGDWSGETGVIKYLMCHVRSQNHVTEGLSNFMSESPSWYVTTLSSLRSGYYKDRGPSR